MQALTGHWMIQSKSPRVEHQAARLLGGFTRFAVDWIADEWSPFVMQVNADLVGASGVEVAYN